MSKWIVLDRKRVYKILTIIMVFVAALQHDTTAQTLETKPVNILPQTESLLKEFYAKEMSILKKNLQLLAQHEQNWQTFYSDLYQQLFSPELQKAPDEERRQAIFRIVNGFFHQLQPRQKKIFDQQFFY